MNEIVNDKKGHSIVNDKQLCLLVISAPSVLFK